ncbi:Glycosyltransferase involved in cell wall bisynthesis [Neorhodopirellula lusitana]|uniref:Glycosyltransferase involved in cell wall bisynthesis n=1 Tax=Neorhodopirellula lusitana TaxID=445327 RepID=A0ABY1QDN4_9BACT|nr:glycosyltransferase family 4 protein [Neorhodopirellula lusitana]SMP68353.1 Glycosyltransferase involved in cell wall bisynthesis [Neorhodopirellula lusitana]
MKIVFLTAGAAGMFCGSCMHDNALAKALIGRWHDVLLQPVYTPIRTDDVSIAGGQVWFGGIHVYLLQQFPLLRFVPRFLRSWMDRPGIIRLATRRAVNTDPAKLGELTLSMLRGEHGRQAEEVERLVRWLETEIRPDAILLSNLLIGGAIPVIRQRLPNAKIVTMLQGDDIFLDHLPDEIRAQAIVLCSELSKHVHRFVTYSDFYRDKMCSLLAIEESKVDVHPLSIDLKPFLQSPRPLPETATKKTGEFRVGYLARIAPEKGLHVLVEAFKLIANDSRNDHLTLHVAGWLGEHNAAYLEDLQQRMTDAGLAGRFVYHGSPKLDEKVDLLRSFDLMSVPSPYEDPKGLFVLEAWAANVPVLQPGHGAFPELINAAGGGECFPPENHHALAERIVHWSRHPELVAGYAQNAADRLAMNHGIDVAAQRMENLLIS